MERREVERSARTITTHTMNFAARVTDILARIWSLLRLLLRPGLAFGIAKDESSSSARFEALLSFGTVSTFLDRFILEERVLANA